MLEAKQGTLEKPHTTQKAVWHEERESKMPGPKDTTQVEYLAGEFHYSDKLHQRKKYIYIV